MDTELVCAVPNSEPLLINGRQTFRVFSGIRKSSTGGYEWWIVI